ncbi:MAG: DUF620 domain-containing protein [bacterium]|nr:DUF620 domain-containing protein [bacterium]
MKKNVIILVSLLILAIPALGATAVSNHPAAETIINKYIDAMGGLEVWEGHTTMKAVGKLSMPAMGISGEVVSWRKTPNYSRTQITSAAFGSIDEGFDGEHAWESSMMSGSKIKDGSELALARRMSEFNIWANWKDYYQAASTLGLVTVESQECYHVEMVPNEGEGEPEQNYFSVETGLLVKTSLVMNNDMGRITIDSFLSDYRDVEGLLVPFKARQVLMGMQEMIMTFETQEFDVEVPEGTFVMPDEIKALLEKK